MFWEITDYGSALQSRALYTSIRQFGKGHFEPVLVDYCSDILFDADPL